MAVTFVMSAFAWSLGWRGWLLALLAVTMLLGQLSVGWSNDAFDARTDAAAGRTEKPTVAGLVTSRALWIGAWTALLLSAALSWLVAGFGGGSFHLLALAMAWTYNTVLSRTAWSWLPYALAFGAMPAFLSYGLNGMSPALWSVAVFAIVGVSAHLANALPDVDLDSAAGLDGLAVRLGPRRGLLLCWLLLGVGSAILVGVTIGPRPIVASVIVAAFGAAVAASVVVQRPSVMFKALLAIVAIDVIALVLAGSLAG